MDNTNRWLRIPAIGRYATQAWLWLAAVLLLALVMACFQLKRTYDHLHQQERSRLQTQAQVVAENLRRQIAGVNNALAAVRYDVALADDTGAYKLAPLRLKALRDAMPGVRSIYVMDSTGTVLSADRSSLLYKNFSDRQYFSAASTNPDYSALYVSPPFTTIFDTLSVNLSKPFADTKGRLAGVVTASLDPDYFGIVTRSVLYAPDMVVAIAHGDGKAFVHISSASRQADVPAPDNAQLFVQHVASGQEQSLLEGAYGPAGEERMVVLRTIFPAELRMDRPLVVEVSRNLHEVYAPWRDDVTLYVLLYTLLCASSSVLVFLLLQRRGVERKQQRERRAIDAENAKRLAFGLEGAELGLWDWNIDGDSLTVNDRELAIMGYAPGEIEITPEAWRLMIHPGDWSQVFGEFIAHSRANSSAYKVEHRFLHKDGHIVWVLSHTMAIERDTTGRATRILGTHLDISERKKAEAVLKESTQRLELAMQTGSMGVIDWDVPSGRVVMNARGLQIIGLPAEGVEMDITRWQQRSHIDEAADMDARLGALLRGDTATCNAEYRVLHADGHYVWVHMRAQTIALGEAGEPARVMGTFRDISERKEAEFRLASASDLLRRTGKMARVGGFQLEVPSMAMRWTDEMFELYDLPAGALPGYEESLAGYTPESRARVTLAVGEAIEEGKPWSLKAELVTATGRRTWVRMQGEAVTGDNGEVVRVVGALQDVTELEKYESELRRANEQLARLTVTDGLTGVGNRRLFDQTMEKEWQRCARHQVPLALLMVDIDHFKLYNDRHGHIAGDAALTQVAHILADCVQRSGELVARYGGEEFVILLPGIDRDGAAAVAHACQQQMARADIAHPSSPSAGALTLSIGVASVVPDAAQLPAALLNAADRALYTAKAAGRNRYELAVTTPQQRPLATVVGLTGTE